MKLKKGTGFDLVYTFIVKVFFLVGSFLVSTLLARLLGPEGQGRLTAMFVVPNMLITFSDLGIKQSTVFFIGKGKDNVTDIFASSLLIWIFTSLSSIFIVIIYYLLPISGNYIFYEVIIVVIYIPALILSNYTRGILEGKQYFLNVNLKFIISFFVKLIFVISLVAILDLGIIGGAIAMLAAIISESIYQLYIIKDIIVFKPRINMYMVKKLVKKGVLFAIGYFILQMNYKIDILFIEYFSTARELGIYSVGVTVAELIWQLPLAISFVLFAKSANSVSDEEAAVRTAKLLRISLFMLFFPILFLIIIAPYLVSFVFGSEYLESSRIIQLLLPGVFILVMTKILHPAFVARRYPLYVHLIFIVPLIINIVLNMFLIPSMGGYGAGIASTISYSVCGVTYLIVYSKKMNLCIKDLILIKVSDLKMIKNSLI